MKLENLVKHTACSVTIHKTLLCMSQYVLFLTTSAPRSVAGDPKRQLSVHFQN